MSLTEIIIYISTYFTVVPAIVGLSRFSKLSIIQKTLFWMIIFISVNQGISEFTTHVLHSTNNLPFYRAYILLEFLFITRIFLLHDVSQALRMFIYAVLAIFCFFWCLPFILGDFWCYPAYLRFSEGAIVLFYAGAYFLKLFQEAKVAHLSRDVGFWIFGGLVLYFASNSLLFLFSEFVVTLSNPSFNLIWTIHAVLTILLYIAFTIAIRCRTNPK